MRLVLQRVLATELRIQNEIFSSIGKGYLVLLSIEEGDSVEDAKWLAGKVCSMRLMQDEEGKMNLDLTQANGELMIVSQFTLHASTKKGNRPSFIRAARPETAIPLYEYFILQCEKNLNKKIKTGKFGADMQISLTNDGPVTITMDTANKE